MICPLFLKIGGIKLQYMIAFLEGIITFVSPCLLPMLPIYITYFANGENNRFKTLKNAIGFVAGFSLVFITLGAFAGTIGSVLQQDKAIVNVITGSIVALLGLNFLGILKIGFLNKTKKMDYVSHKNNMFTSFVFGVVFSIGWTPCVGAFLGSALMLASERGSSMQGVFMLLVYSLGLGVPFIISALIIDKLKATFAFIKKHYLLINRISGIFLVLVGILMMTGMMGYLLALFSI